MRVRLIRSQGEDFVNNQIIGYQFGNYYLNLVEKSLYWSDKPIKLSERMFLFLRELLKASPELVSKEQLHKMLWPDRQVSDWALARIISDTRLLLENNGNEAKAFIKTARGIGYSMVDAHAVYAKDYSNKTKLYLFGVATFTILVLVFAGYKLNSFINHQKLVDAVTIIAKNQDYSYRAFKSQALRRNELVAQIELRLNIKRQRQFEKFFAHYFDQMNKEELFIFSQIRAITTGSLYKANQTIYNILENNPDIYEKIPKTQALAEHLKFWLNKYYAVFLQRKDMCLLYVGVEDGVPYPNHVDQLIKDWLKNKNY